MRWQLRCFYFFLVVLVIASCEAAGVSPQTTTPGEINSSLQSPTQTLTPMQMTIPEMTGTALAWPTVVYPTEKPLTPEEIFQLSQLKTISADGNFVITCDYSVSTLFHAPTITVIATTDREFGCDSERTSWSPDSSYVFLVEGMTEDIYRWRIDGSPPEFLEFNKLFEQKKLHYPDWTVKMLPSPDGKYLAIHKFDLYVVTPDDEESFKNPLLIVECAGCFEEFRWITPRLLLVRYFKSVSLVHIPSGNGVAGIWTSGGLCAEQIPLFSPDGRWIVSDAPWCGGGGIGPNQSIISNLEDGSRRVFSESFADRIDLVGWSQDSSEFYLVSRPTTIEALPDPRTPFGLLAMNPETLQVQNLFEQAWFVSFNKEFSWAYVVFPVKNDDGSLRFDGGLWEVGTSQLIGRQIMANSLEEIFLAPSPYLTVQPFYSFTGEELGSSSSAAVRLVPAIWSHDNLKVATINSDRQLVIIDLTGTVQIVGQLGGSQEWHNSGITWSENDRSLNVDGVTWAIP
jgi:hypothetical protein